MASVASGTQNVGDKSTESFLTALVTNAAIGAATLGAFLILRRRFRNVYEPRYALKPTGPKQSPLPQGFLSFIPAVFRAKDEDIIRHNGLDAYLFNRFIKLLFYFFLPVAIVSWAVLLPVYGTGSNGNVQLNRFTFGNIGADQQPRLAAPLILAWASTLGFLWLIRREWLNYIQTRREFLTSRGWATRPQAKTVLITGLPKDYASESALRSLTSHLQGGVAHIWIAKDVSELADVYERQMDAAQKLEKANIKVIKQATKAARKDKAPAGGSSDGQHGKSLATKYLKPKKLPHHRLGKIPFFGKKVETIPWAEEEIETTQKELDAGRSNPDKYESRPSALILFNDQIDAHIFAQGGEEGESKTLKLCKRFINVSPDDIVWSNLGRKPLLNKGLKVVSLTITTLITIFYAPITVFVTGVSNVSSLCGTVSFLGWLCDLPSPINGIIQGALPPLALALVFLLVPIVFRLLIKLEGIPLQSQIEHRLERRYFVFLFLQGFLLATISSGIVKSISTITQDPSATVNILAQNLPAAATFFITLILVHGLTKAGLGILQAPKFLLYFAKVKLLGSTPRSLLNAQQSIPQVQFGTEYPNSLLIAVIGLSYSTISPIVCGFSAFAFFTWWFVYKYLALYVWDQPPETETAGLFFKTALNQLFAGIYIYLLCLTGLFFLSRNESNSLSTAGLACGVCSAILLGLSILVQIYLNWRLGSASVYLDASMADQTRQNERRYAQEMAAEKASPNGGMRPVDTRATDGTAVGAGGDDQKAGKGRKDAYVERDVESGDGHGHGHQRDSTGPAEADGELAGGLDETTFMHPALYREQPTVWLPRDQLGLSREAVERARARGVQITDEDATIDNDGKIDIQTDELPGEDHDANL